MQRRPSRSLTALLASVVGAVALALPAATASAAERPAAAQGSGEVCAAQAQPVLTGQDAELLPPTPVECFDTLEEALAFVSGRPLAEAEALTERGADLESAARTLNARSAAAVGSAATSERTVAAAASASLILGVIYRDNNYSGRSTLLWGQGTNGCRTGSTYGFPNLANFTQNNVISSAESFVGCWSTFYNEYSYWGDRRNCTPNCATMGTMNNRASSIVYRPSGTLG